MIHAPTIDRSKREHIAEMRAVVFSNKDDDFIILRLSDDSTAKGKQPANYFASGISYRFLGRWQAGRHGPEFCFDSVVVDTPASRVGVMRYLTDFAPNVGTKTAAKLFDLYGPDAVKVLREEPGRVFEDRIMSLDAAKEAGYELTKFATLERTKIDLFQLFTGRGFHGKAIDAAIKKWGAKAPQIIRRNPFTCLLAKLPGAGFKRCDKMWLDVGRPATALKRQMLCAWNAMRIDSSGHTWFQVEDVGRKIREAIDSVNVNPVKALKLGKRAGWLRFRRDDGKIWVAEAKKADNEQAIADNLHRLSAWTGESLWPASIPVSQADGDGLPSDHQHEKAIAATAGPVGVLAGSPGTGKTHTLAFILRDVIAAIGRTNVAVCAPTGKAAVRATQSLVLRGIDLRATTIHRMLGIGRNGHDGDGWGFVYNRSNPLPYRVIVVDETSMIDTDLMASLLEACADGTHVLFVGDPYQLPPVGHGAPLRDLIAAGVPYGELTQVRRNAGQIVHACLRIKNGEQFETAERVDLDAGKNLLLLETSSDAESIERLTGILANAKRFNPVWATQVIVALNKQGLLSRVSVNDKIHGLLNPDGKAVANNTFRVGDKIICLKNSTMRVVENEYGDATDPGSWTDVSEGGDTLEAYVANGEIGRVLAVGEKQIIARMGEEDYCIRVPMGKPAAGQGQEGDEPADEEGREASDGEKGRGCNFDLAYAITVHKSQGSESPCVIVLVDSRASMIADRNWYYTAVSRASKLCVLIGQRGVMDKQRIKQSLVKRKTFLRELIHASNVQET